MQENLLTTKPIAKLIKDIALPASIGLVFNSLYNIVDMLYAGTISTNALIALSYSVSLYFMFFGTFFGFLTGVKSLIGKYLGSGNNELAILYSHQGVVLALFTACFVFLINYLFSYDFFSILRVPEKAMEYTLSYYNTVIYCFFAVIINASLNASLTSKGDSKSYRNSLIIGFFLNLILNPIFMYGYWIIPAMGIKGIAFSTVIIFSMHTFYLLYKCVKINMIDILNLKLFLPSFKLFMNILKLGWASGFNMLLMSLGSIITIYFLSMYSPEAIAGFGIGYRIEQVMLLPIFGINTAVLAIVSNNFGAMKYYRVKDSFYLSLKYAYILSIFGVFILAIFSYDISSFFSDDALVLKYASLFIMIDSLTFFAYATIFVSIATLQGVSKVKMIFIISIFRQIILPLFLFYFITNYLQLPVEYLFICILLINYLSAYFIFKYVKKVLLNIRTNI
jgi:putative MATE family efflux protein